MAVEALDWKGMAWENEFKKLLIFFVIAFAWSWIFWFIEIIFGVSLFLGPFGPTASAIILTFYYERWNGTKTLLKRGIDYSFNKIWFIPIFFLMPALVGLSLLLAVILGDPLPELTALSQPLFIVVAFFYILFLGGPLEEEFGWRGFALDRLQLKFNALNSSIILGIIWGLWHLPLFFMPGQDIYRNVPILGFIAGAVFLSILFTWIYNNTGGSILAVILFHTTSNLAQFVFPAVATTWGGLISVILNVVVVVVIIIVFGAKRMAREKNEKS